jgi:hypothetical protein
LHLRTNLMFCACCDVVKCMNVFVGSILLDAMFL